MKILKWIRRIGGTILFIVGLVSLLLPIIPGWFLIGIGLYLLAVDSVGMQHRISVIRARHKLIDRLFAPLDRFTGHAQKDAATYEDDVRRE